MRRGVAFLAAGLIALAAPAGLESLARAYRESPTPARRAALQRFATAHKADNNGALARLALGVTAYEQKNFSAAIENLKAARRLGKLEDYTGYYLAAAEVESQSWPEALKDLDQVDRAGIRSPLLSRALVLRARALVGSGAPARAEELLRVRYGDLSQPEGDLALGGAAHAAGDLQHAAVYWQQVYFRYPATDAAAQAAAALENLRATLGAAYPEASAQQKLERPARWLDAREYGRARSEYQALAEQSSGANRDLARVGAGVADYRAGDTRAARDYLRSLQFDSSPADAERLYYLAECARKLGDDDDMMATVERLGLQYPHSHWRFRALLAAGNRFLLANRPDRYEPLYREAYQDFPKEPQAAYCEWKTAWCSYMQRRPDAAQRLREHLDKFPRHTSASATLYYLGRLAERGNDYAAARAWYDKLAAVFPNYYYGVLARERLAQPALASASGSAQVAEYLRGIPLPETRPPNRRPTAETTLRLERARLLGSAGLSDWAEAELRFGIKSDGQPYLLALELARFADSPHQRLRFVKTAVPDYLSLGLDGAPRALWEALFPMPYRQDLLRYARQQHLDPFVVAGLIRQESEFNPQAVSSAHALGLTQVMPATGRQIARRAGLRRFSSRSLFQPSTNLRLGTYYLRAMLDQWNGKWEQTLASYNAGKTRVNDWVTWSEWQDPAEFVESIPFTETREYVQAVLRNAAVYRQLYEKAGPAEASPAKSRRPARKLTRRSRKSARG